MKPVIALIFILAATKGFAQNTPATSKTSSANSKEIVQQLQPFHSDGCSSSPDGVPMTSKTSSLAHCCIVHDFSYWAGGYPEDKEAADENLRLCISKTSGSDSIGYVYKFGVLMGGGETVLGMSSPFPWRWGYGWTKPFTDYQALLSSHQKNLSQELQLLDEKVAALLFYIKNKDQQKFEFLEANLFPRMVLTPQQLEYSYQELKKVKARVWRELYSTSKRH